MGAANWLLNDVHQVILSACQERDTVLQYERKVYSEYLTIIDRSGVEFSGGNKFTLNTAI